MLVTIGLKGVRASKTLTSFEKHLPLFEDFYGDHIFTSENTVTQGTEKH